MRCTDGDLWCINCAGASLQQNLTNRERLPASLKRTSGVPSLASNECHVPGVLFRTGSATHTHTHVPSGFLGS